MELSSNEALGAQPHEVLRILKNVYGNSTAPRGLWADVDQTMKKLGGRRLIGDSSFWVFATKNPKPLNEADTELLLGYVGGHVDDFQQVGIREGEPIQIHWIGHPGQRRER